MLTVKRGAIQQNGKPIKLAGNHTWNTVQPFDGRTTSLDRLTGNFTRLWTVETAGMVPGASIWGSNSKGLVRVGLTPWKQDGSLRGRYYDRLEQVVRKAERRDMIVGVCLFDHAFTAYFPQGWERHPLNGLGPASAQDVHTRGPWNRYQRAHVKRVAKTLAPYGNVLAEVGNELHRSSVGWFQPKVVSWWRRFSDAPVGVSYAGGLRPSTGSTQDWITRTGADWAAPSGGARVPGFKGAYVFDTDHASALRPNVAGLRDAWRRGDALWLMDGLDGNILRNQGSLAPDRAYLAGLT